jgi:hypothetical protein
MGVLDDAIRDHLALKRKHGADEAELARAEAEALGPARREPPADPYVEGSAAFGEAGGSVPYDVQADETATTPFDHQGGVTYEPPAPGAPTRIAPAPPADVPPPDEPVVEEPPPAAYEPPAEPSLEHPPASETYEPPPVEHPPPAQASAPAEPYEPPPAEHPPPAEAYEPPPVEHPPPSQPYEPPPAEHPPAGEAYEPAEPPPPAEPYEHTPPPAAGAHEQPELGGDDPHDYEDFSYKGEPEPPGHAAAAEEPAVPGHDEPVGQGDPLVPYSWHPEEPDAPHEDPRAPHEEPEALHGAEVVHEEEEVVHEPQVVQDAEVVHEAADEEPAPSPVGEHDDTAVKPPDEAYREAAAHQPTEYFTPPDVEPVQESRGRRLRRLFSRKSER